MHPCCLAGSVGGVLWPCTAIPTPWGSTCRSLYGTTQPEGDQKGVQGGDHSVARSKAVQVGTVISKS